MRNKVIDLLDQTIEELDKAGFDTTELWKQYDSVAGEIHQKMIWEILHFHVFS